MRYAPVASLIALASTLAAGEAVHKVAEPAESTLWKAGAYNTAKVAIGLADQAPAELAAASKRSLAADFTFSGKGFEFATAEPPAPLTIPGETRSISLWYKGDGQNYGLTLNLAEGWGREQVDGHKVEWSFGSAKTTAWTRATFTIPRSWQQPVRISGLTMHNWGQDKQAATVKVLIDQIEVDTGIAGADPATGRPAGWKPNPNPDPKKKAEPPPPAPLLEATLSSAAIAQVFAGTPPAFVLAARNWNAGTLKGSLAWTLSALGDGSTPAKLKDGTLAVEVDSVTALPLPMPVPRLGLYRLDTVLTWADGRSSRSSLDFASIPPRRPLDDQAKDASPYGINMHGGRRVFPATYRDAGAVWFRDYAFTWDWMLRAKGEDKKYGGWPWYPMMMARAEAADIRLLPILVNSIQVVDGKNGPDRTWRTELTDILGAFPTLKAWEIDNEHDGGWTEHGRKETAGGFRNYNAYHKVFGDVLETVGGGELTAVENGRAGIHPGLVEAAVRSGSFERIQVINGHHYCGIDAPELNIANQNTGGEGEGDAQLFHDRMAAQVRAGRVDGKQRESWITEFGWDTRIAKVVTPWQQAAFLQRGFLTMFHAGISKGFWYWDVDEGPVPHNFFDGCGLIDHRDNPKLGLAAFAGLTRLLPQPQVRGTLDAGDGTFGFLVRQGKERVAALWSLEKDDGPEVSFASGELFDFLSNPLPGRKARLSLAPVYAVGLDEDDRFARQGSWDLAGDWLVHASAGDQVAVRVVATGDRTAAVKGSVALSAPAGWTVPPAQAVEAAPGATRAVDLVCTVPSDAKPGEQRLLAVVSEGEVLKRMPVRVMVRPPLALDVARLTGEPGRTELAVTVVNKSMRAMAGTMKLALPASWKAERSEVAVETLKPGESRKLKLPLSWSAEWKPDERAGITVASADGSRAEAGIRPGALAVHRLPAFKPDGDLAEWPAQTRIPDWVLACSEADPKADLRLAWTPEGLAVGMKVADSTMVVDDPKSFWHADALELLVDTRDRGKPRPAAGGERQLWLMAQANGGIYAGQWKRGNEVPATRYGIPEVTGASRKVGDGYVLEALIPAAVLGLGQPKAGDSASAVLFLKVCGKTFHREIGWPATKAQGTGGGIESWPVLVFAE